MILIESSAVILEVLTMPKKTRAKFGIDPVQRVEQFSFTDAQIKRVFEALGPIRSSGDDIIFELEKCVSYYFWLKNQYRLMPPRAAQNARLKEIQRLTSALKMVLAGLDKDTEWELMSRHPAFEFGDLTIEIPDLVDRLEDFEQA